MVLKQKNCFHLLLALTLFGSFYPLVSEISDLSKIISIINTKKDKKEPIGVKDFPGFLDKINLPQGMKSVIENIQIAVPEIKNTIESFGVSGEAVIKEIAIQATFSIKKSTKKMCFKITLPKGIDFKKSFPELKDAADILSTAIGPSFFIISDFRYLDSELDLFIEPGFNFGAIIDLTGPLKKLQDWFDILIKNLNGKESELKKNKTTIQPGFVFIEKVAVALCGVIPTNPLESMFTIILPWRIGLDFTKAFQDPYIKKLMTADFKASVSVKGEGSMSGGLILEIKSQTDPLEFRLGVEVEAIAALAVEAQMKGSYKPAFGLSWLGIGPLGAKIGLMAEPPWLDEIAFKGGLSLGTVLSVQEGILALDLSSGNVLFKIEGANLDIDDLIELLITMAATVSKQNIKMPDIPTIEFKNMNLKFAPVSMMVFEEYHPAGIAAAATVKIGKFEGGINVDIQTEQPKIYAKGFLNKFEVKTSKQGKTIFMITGIGEDKKIGTKDDKAMLEIDLAPNRTIKDQKIIISGIIDIPPIKFKHECDVRWEEGKFTTEVETNLGNIFSGLAKISFDTDEPSDFYFKLAMEQKASKMIRKEVEKAMTTFEQNAQKDLNKAKKDIEAIDEKMDVLRRKRDQEFKKIESGAAKEVKKFKRKVAKIDKELEPWKKECERRKIKKIEYPFRECGQQIIKLELEKTGLKIAEGILSAGEKIIAGVGKAVAKIDEALKLDEAAQKVARAGLTVAEGTVEAISEVTKAITSGVFVLESGSVETSGADLKEKKLPKVSLKIQIVKDVTLDLKDMQMDLDEPDEFFKDLAGQIIKSFEKKKKK